MNFSLLNNSLQPNLSNLKIQARSDGKSVDHTVSLRYAMKRLILVIAKFLWISQEPLKREFQS